MVAPEEVEPEMESEVDAADADTADQLVTAVIKLAGDYSMIVLPARELFLLECRALFPGVKIIDVQSGSILLTVQGAGSAIAAMYDSIQKNGFKLPSFPLLSLASGEEGDS